MPAGLPARYMHPPASGPATHYYAPPAKKAKTGAAHAPIAIPSPSAMSDELTPGGRGRREKKPPAWLVEDTIDIDEAIALRRKIKHEGGKGAAARKVFATVQEEVAQLEGALTRIFTNGGLWSLTGTAGTSQAPPAAVQCSQLDLPPWVWNGLSHYAPEEAGIAKQAVDLFSATHYFGSREAGGGGGGGLAHLDVFSRLSLMVAASSGLRRLREDRQLHAQRGTALSQPGLPTGAMPTGASGLAVSTDPSVHQGAGLPAGLMQGATSAQAAGASAAALHPGAAGILKVNSPSLLPPQPSASRVTFAEQLETVHPIESASQLPHAHAGAAPPNFAENAADNGGRLHSPGVSLDTAPAGCLASPQGLASGIPGGLPDSGGAAPAAPANGPHSTSTSSPAAAQQPPDGPPQAQDGGACLGVPPSTSIAAAAAGEKTDKVAMGTALDALKAFATGGYTAVQ